jgi:hypothetical protein
VVGEERPNRRRIGLETGRKVGHAEGVPGPADQDWPGEERVAEGVAERRVEDAAGEPGRRAGGKVARESRLPHPGHALHRDESTRNEQFLDRVKIVPAAKEQAAGVERHSDWPDPI